MMTRRETAVVISNITIEERSSCMCSRQCNNLVAQQTMLHVTILNKILLHWKGTKMFSTELVLYLECTPLPIEQYYFK